MSTEVELFEFNDIPSRPSIRGLIDANGVAQIEANDVVLPQFATDPQTGAVTGLGGPGGANLFTFTTSQTIANCCNEALNQGPSQGLFDAVRLTSIVTARPARALYESER